MMQLNYYKSTWIWLNNKICKLEQNKKDANATKKSFFEGKLRKDNAGKKKKTWKKSRGGVM
jgi:hypothetical protein